MKFSPTLSNPGVEDGSAVLQPCERLGSDAGGTSVGPPMAICPPGDSPAEPDTGCAGSARDMSDGRQAVAPLKSSIARNVLSNWSVTAVAIAYSLVVTPIVIDALRAELYGVWSFLNGLLVYSDLLYFGIGTALVRHVARHTARPDRLAINRLCSVVFSIFTVLGLLCFSAMLALSPAVPRLFATPLEGEAAGAASYTCILLGVQLLCFFPASTVVAILLGHDRFDLVNLARLVTMGIRFSLVGFVVSGPNPLLRLSLFMTLTVVVELALFRYLLYRVNPEVRLAPARPRSEELRLLYGFGLQSFLIVFSSKLISYSDTTVIALTLGASSVSAYVLPLQLIEYMRTALFGFTGVLLPRLTGLFDRGDLGGLQRAYLQSTKIACLLAAFLITNMLWLGEPFLTIWVGPEFGRPARWVVVYLAGAMLFHVFSTIVAVPFYQALNIMTVPAKVLVLEAAANLGLSVVFARMFGIDGVALATVLPAFFVGFLVLPRYLCRNLSLPVSALFSASLPPALVVAASITATHWLISGWIPADSYGSLVARALATVPVAAATAVLSLSSVERRHILYGVRGMLPCAGQGI
jgi:O-antigen/teichoic acid export membrane protein